MSSLSRHPFSLLVVSPRPPPSLSSSSPHGRRRLVLLHLPLVSPSSMQLLRFQKQANQADGRDSCRIARQFTQGRRRHGCRRCCEPKCAGTPPASFVACRSNSGGMNASDGGTKFQKQAGRFFFTDGEKCFPNLFSDADGGSGLWWIRVGGRRLQQSYGTQVKRWRRFRFADIGQRWSADLGHGVVLGDEGETRR